jgi:acetyl esterase
MREPLDIQVLRQARRAIRMALARPNARAKGLARVEDITVPGAAGSLPARLYEAENATGPLILYLHGGGFVCCDLDTHDGVCSWLAKSAGARLISVAYRLAPETQFPGQLLDARVAAAWALDRAHQFGATRGKLVVSGDSAGAWLASACALEINAATPGAVVLQALLYPLVHLQDSLWAAEEVRNLRFVGRLAALYIAKSLGAELMPSLLDLPLAHAPTTIIAGGGALDPVRADVKAYVHALGQAGVRVIERKYPALLHGGINLTEFSKTARSVLEDVGALIGEEVKR